MLFSHCLVLTQSTRHDALAIYASLYFCRCLLISAPSSENDCCIFNVDVKPKHDGMFALLIWDTNVTIHVSITPPNFAAETFSVRAPAIVLFCGMIDSGQLNVW
jgi:hypothetical protein